MPEIRLPLRPMSSFAELQAAQANRLREMKAEPQREHLDGLPLEKLSKLQRSFFEAAHAPEGQPNLDVKNEAAFSQLSPQEILQLLKNLPSETFSGYFDKPEVKQNDPVETQQANPPPKQNNENPKPMPRLFAKDSLTGSVSPSELPQVLQMQQAMQTMLTKMSGEKSDMKEFLDVNCFEDLLMMIFMKIGRDEEKKLREKIRSVERGHAGLTGVLNDGTRKLGGLAGGAIGGALGGWFSGPTGGVSGAAVGQDVGERLAGSYAGTPSNTPESRQLQFEQLKYAMQKMSEMLSCISNISSTMHKNNMRAIENIRG